MDAERDSGPPERFDVIVVGGGGAGMAAAISAAETDPEADLLLLQKEDELGGVTGIAMGSFAAAETYLQREAGIDDSADAHFEDMDKFVASAAAGGNRHISYDYEGDLREKDDLKLRRLLVKSGGETLEWLRGIGCSYVGPFEEGEHRVPRMHVVESDYAEVLGRVLDDRGVTVWCGSSATGLLQDETGAVVGVSVRRTGDEIEVEASRGVVLATGSYVNNRALRKRYTANSSAEAIYEQNTGDGHEMARAAGAELVNMDVQSVFLRCEAPLYTGPDFASLVDAGAILLNRNGERFVNELAEYDQIVSAAEDQPGRRIYVLFDEAIADEFRSWPNHISTFSGKPWGYVEDYLATDFLVREPSLDEVAGHLVGTADALRGTVERYNRGVEYPGAGRRDEFGRTRHRERLSASPWYLLGPMRPYAAVTNGGVAIDDQFRALDGSGQTIPGLYAAGSVAGGVHLFGHGHHHAWIFTSGRFAGRAATGQ